MVFHVLNRANGRLTMFETDDDYKAFVQMVSESLLLVPTRILTYCLMPNHWHFVMWPERDDELSAFFHHLTTTHVRRWHRFHNTEGQGHLYQGPFKSFPVEDDDHFYTVSRYVERNARRACLVDRVEDWIWGGFWAYLHPRDHRTIGLANWPLPRPAAWADWINQPLTESELNAVRTSARRGRPYGNPPWQELVAERLSLEYTLRSPGRPRTKMSMLASVPT
jgi:putative transposase